MFAYILRVADAAAMYGTTEYFYSHLTDFARMLALYRYGGTYIDTDILLLRSIDDMDDFVGMESGSLLTEWTHVPRGNMERVVVNGAATTHAWFILVLCHCILIRAVLLYDYRRAAQV